jgi:hypothetical protein
MKTRLTIALLALDCGIILFANPIFAMDSVTNLVEQVKAKPFQVTITPTKKAFHTNEPICIYTKVENVTETNQTVVLWSCSWWEQFRSTSLQIKLWPGYHCTANAPLSVEIPAGKSWEKELKLWVSEPVLTNTVSFQIKFVPLDYVQPRFEDGHFTPLVLNDSKISFLSNEATIDLISN